MFYLKIILTALIFKENERLPEDLAVSSVKERHRKGFDI